MIDLFAEILSTFWFVLPIIAVIILYIFWTGQKKISNKVLYVRRGNTMEFMACQVKGGSHVIFKPDKTSSNVTVQLKDKPYLYVQGGNMYRVYIVREGGGSTIRLGSNPDLIIDFKKAMEHCYNMLPESVRLNLSTEDFSKSSESFLEFIGANDEAENMGFGDDEDIDEPTARAAASSISLFERVNEFIISNLPKGKTQYLVMFIYLIIGYLGGMTLGILIDRIWLK